MARTKNRTEAAPAPSLLPAASTVGVQRAVKTWLNTCPNLPSAAPSVSFEDLQANETGLCFATMQTPFYTAKYILGGYAAEFKFRLIYRVLPTDDADMLDAVEALTEIGGWCETATQPELPGAVNVHTQRTTDAAILAVYEDGTNDYSIDLTLSWEVFN